MKNYPRYNDQARIMSEVQNLIRNTPRNYLVHFFANVQAMLGDPRNSLQFQKRNESFSSFLERGTWFCVNRIEDLTSLFEGRIPPSIENEWDDVTRRSQICIAQSSYDPIGRLVK